MFFRIAGASASSANSAVEQIDAWAKGPPYTLPTAFIGVHQRLLFRGSGLVTRCGGPPRGSGDALMRSEKMVAGISLGPRAGHRFVYLRPVLEPPPVARPKPRFPLPAQQIPAAA